MADTFIALGFWGWPRVCEHSNSNIKT